MPRRAYKKTTTHPDPVYDSFEVSKLINYIMYDGKKSVARAIVYEVLERLKEIEADPTRALTRAIANVTPTMEVRPRRLGGASYMVPTEVRKDRKLFLALNWIVEGARARSNKEYHTFTDKLVAELKDAINSVGSAYNKKLSVEKQAEQNKAFAHLKW
ncbi:MAG TPA: 30S ribosomal protein S7 [Candidatus Woesebacteria bacterium]|nr:30S ribosomal protein S7 [Candidatus Woesebacteria bacterium]HNS95268.1 30S ribosomal protein S7 [Candidatus Woesebacteria bacterium]